MKPPVNMPLPWVIASVADERCRTCVCIFDKDGRRFNGTSAIDQGDAAAYIQHCVNNYQELVEALKFYSTGKSIEPCGEDMTGTVFRVVDFGTKAQEALRKAGE